MGLAYKLLMRLMFPSISSSPNTVFSNIQAVLSGTDVIVTWDTSNAVASIINWGLSSGVYPSNKLVSGARTSHTITLNAADGLVDLTVYHFIVSDGLTDSGDNTFTSADFPTVISAVGSSVYGTSVVFAFTTSEPGTTGIEFGLTTAYGSAVINGAETNVTTHSLMLDSSDGLLSNTLYHYRVYSNGVYSTDYTFTTAISNYVAMQDGLNEILLEDNSIVLSESGFTIPIGSMPAASTLTGSELLLIETGGVTKVITVNEFKTYALS